MSTDSSRARSVAACCGILLLAAVLRLTALDYHLPYVEESDAWLTVQPVQNALSDDMARLFAEPAVYTLYGSLYSMVVWAVSVPMALLQALRQDFSSVELMSGTVSVERLLSRTDIIVVARLVSAGSGIAAVWIAYLLGRRLFGMPVALISAFFMAVVPVAVHYSAYVKEVGLLLPIANVSILFLLDYGNSGRQRSYLASCGFAGLAASVQVTGFVFVLASLVGATVLSRRRPETMNAAMLIRGFLWATGAYVVGNPTIVLATGDTLSRMGWLLAQLGVDRGVPPGWIQIREFLPYFTGAPIFYLGLVGFIVCAIARDERALVASLAPLCVLGIAATSTGRIVSYYLLVITPWLCVMAALAVVSLLNAGSQVLSRVVGSSVVRRERWTAVGLVAGCIVVAIPAVRASIADVRTRLTDTPEIRTGRWLERNLPTRVFVGSDADFPSLGNGTANYWTPPRLRRVPGRMLSIADGTLEQWSESEVRFLAYDPRRSNSLQSSDAELYDAFYSLLKDSWSLVFKEGRYEIYGAPMRRLEAETMIVEPVIFEEPQDLPEEFVLTPPPYGHPYAAPEGNPMYQIPYSFVEGLPADGPGSRSTLMVYENGIPLGPAHARTEEILSQGRGLFSHWETAGVLFSTSDNSDPNTNGRQYAVSSDISGVVLPPGFTLRYPWPLKGRFDNFVLRVRLVSGQVPVNLAVGFVGGSRSLLTVVDDMWRVVGFKSDYTPGETLFEVSNAGPLSVWVDYIEAR